MSKHMGDVMINTIKMVGCLFLCIFSKNIYGADIPTIQNDYIGKIVSIAKRISHSPDDIARLKMGSYSDDVTNQINQAIDIVLDQKVDTQPIFPTPQTKIFALQNMGNFFTIENPSSSKIKDAHLLLKPIIYKSVMGKITELEKQISPGIRILINKQDAEYNDIKDNVEDKVLPKPFITGLSSNAQTDLWLNYFKNRYNIIQDLKLNNIIRVKNYIKAAQEEYKDNPNATKALNSIDFVLEAADPKAIEIEAPDLNALTKQNEKNEIGSEEYKKTLKNKFPAMSLNPLQKPSMRARLDEKINKEKEKESILASWKSAWRKRQEAINQEQNKSIFGRAYKAYESFKAWWRWYRG